MAISFRTTDQAFSTLMQAAGNDILLVERALAEATREAHGDAPSYSAVLSKIKLLRREPAAA
jgi:hypothetical protein